MSEILWVSIISASAALLGGVIGYIASEVQATRSFKRQFQLEKKKMAWAVEDEIRKHGIGVLTRRCDQIEEFVYTHSEDFHNIRHSTIYILKSNDPVDIQQRIQEYGHWRDNIPKRVYAYGASIASLGNTDLVASWKNMNLAFQTISDLYMAVCSAKEKDPGPYQHHGQILGDIDKAYDDINISLGRFLSQLDEIRSLHQSPRVEPTAEG